MGTIKSQNPHLRYGDLPKLIDSPNRVVLAVAGFQRISDNGGDPVANIELMTEKAQGALHAKQLFRMDWHMTFMHIGRQALRLLPKDFDLAQFAELVQKKNSAYGDDPIEAWGELGVMIRIDSKLKRYKNLTSNPELNAKDNGESALDTMTDILGYAVLGYRLTTRKMAHHTPDELKRREEQMLPQQLPKADI